MSNSLPTKLPQQVSRLLQDDEEASPQKGADESRSPVRIAAERDGGPTASTSGQAHNGKTPQPAPSQGAEATNVGTGATADGFGREAPEGARRTAEHADTPIEGRTLRDFLFTCTI